MSEAMRNWPAKKVPPAIREMALRVAERHLVTADQVLSHCNYKVVVAARAELVHRINARYGWSTTRIGQVLGFHHSTIWHALQKPRPAELPARITAAAKPGTARKEFDFSEPDESGVWAI